MRLVIEEEPSLAKREYDTPFHEGRSGLGKVDPFNDRSIRAWLSRHVLTDGQGWGDMQGGTLSPAKRLRSYRSQLLENIRFSRTQGASREQLLEDIFSIAD